MRTIWTTWLALAALAFTLLGGPPAHALCAEVPIEGEWVRNPIRPLIGADELRFDFLCQDQIGNGNVWPPGDPYTIHSPWGTVAGTGHLGVYEFVFDEPGRTRTLSIRASNVYPNELYATLIVTYDDSSIPPWSDAGSFVRPDTSCYGNCGAGAGTCWCDSACTSLGDCCFDYEVECVPGNSCAGECGGNAGQCFCDTACAGYGDCCDDVELECAPGPPPAPPPLTCDSTETLCDGACVDTLSDADNCGGCGITCGFLEICTVGQCENITL